MHCIEKRTTATDALNHPWFTESPMPIDPSMFPMWPAKSEKTAGGQKTPPAPAPGAGHINDDQNQPDLDAGFSIAAAPQQRGGGFTLKF